MSLHHCNIGQRPLALRDTGFFGLRVQAAQSAPLRTHLKQSTQAAQSLQGTVVSVASAKTAVVNVDTFVQDRIYKKQVRKTRKYQVHDENECYRNLHFRKRSPLNLVSGCIKSLLLPYCSTLLISMLLGANPYNSSSPQRAQDCTLLLMFPAAFFMQNSTMPDSMCNGHCGSYWDPSSSQPTA
ncbi:hypothetical protein WJX74_008159 [Apatococcus lobatus]|uniref:Uncharacterized protein n=1 Tax=Apatococcus lobatus TaxID=904363 RepID=A0AAW1S7A7_9CHLO